MFAVQTLEAGVWQSAHEAVLQRRREHDCERLLKIGAGTLLVHIQNSIILHA